MTKQAKTIEQQYKVLDELDHIRLRPGIFIGSTVNHTAVEYIFDINATAMVKQEIKYNPGLIKCVSEVLDNVVDEHKRNPTKLTQLKLDIDLDEKTISVFDNGGIPVVKHTETDVYVPEMIFSMLRSGSNYDDSEDQALIGTNGYGSKLASIFSTWFKVETADGSNYFSQEHSNGMREKSEASVKPSTKSFTRITFRPDTTYFECEFEDQQAKIIKRVVDIAACNPGLKCYVNGKHLKIQGFKDYVNLYTNVYEYDENENWNIAVTPSTDGFQQISFVNSVETFEGGTHVMYIADQITARIREHIKKKHKVDLKPADVRNHMCLMISCNINRPKFNSQTKANMISEIRDYKTKYEITDKFIKNILKSPVIQSVMDWVYAREAANERAELRKLAKDLDRANPKHVENFDDATSKNRQETMLFLVEGISAKSGIMSGRNPKTMGVFPLRGKPINAYEKDVKEVINNAEFKNILTITGLQLGEEAKLENLRFGKIVAATDADCLRHDTLVVMEDGSTKKICDVVPGDSVITHTGKSQIVTDIQNSVKQEQQKIIIENGDEIYCSKDHIIPVYRNNEIVEIVASEIQAGDKMLNLNNDKYVKISVISNTQIAEQNLFVDITVENDNSFIIRTSSGLNIVSHNCDGFAIRGLLMNTFYKFWPELFELGVIHILETPLARVMYKKDIIDFYSMSDLTEWRTAHKSEKFETSYRKGLGSSSSKEWKEYLSDQKLEQNLVGISVETEEDREIFKLLFSKEKGMADRRKDWLGIQE